MAMPARGTRFAATTPRTAVRACGCGTIYLDVGAVTLRLDREGFEAIARTVAEAQRRLAEMPEEAASLMGSCRPEMH